MGICHSRDNRRQTLLTWVETLQVTVLGTRGCGKSTLLRQIQLQYSGFDDIEIQNYRPIIINSILWTTKGVLKKCISKMNDGYVYTAALYILHTEFGFDMTLIASDLGERLALVWKNEVFLEELENHFMSSTPIKHFTKSFTRYSNPGWIPTNQDIIYCYRTSRGIIEFKVSIDNDTYHSFYDVGGVRSERRKWCHALFNTGVVVFVAALSDYCQNLLGDEEENALAESVRVFQQSFKYDSFSSVILVLNKVDVFRYKLCERKIPMNISGKFPDAPQSFNANECIEWIRQYYLKHVPAHNEKQVLSYVVDATKESAIAPLLTACDLLPPPVVRAQKFLTR